MLNHDFCSCFLPFFHGENQDFVLVQRLHHGFSWWILHGNCSTIRCQALDSMFETTSLLPDAALSDVVGALGRNLRTDRAPWQRHFGGKAPGFSERVSIRKRLKTWDFIVMRFSIIYNPNQSNEVCGFIVQFYVSYAWCVSMFVETPWCSISWVHDVNICKK